MARERFNLRQLDDRQLLEGLLRLHQTSAEVMADLLCHLAEVERRGLHLKQATPSLFKYAVVVLGCTEDEAWRRVTAAQTAARFPVVFARVASGHLTLTAVNMLRCVLTEANHLEVLEEAAHKTKAELEVMVARLAPRDDVPTRLARVAERPRTGEQAALELPRVAARAGTTAAVPATPGVAPTAAATTPTVVPEQTASTIDSTAIARPERAPLPPTRPEPARLAPLSPERWKLTLTIGADAERALRKARDLTPDGDLARIVERAVVEYAERLEARKYAKLKGRTRRSAQDETPAARPDEPSPATTPSVAQLAIEAGPPADLAAASRVAESAGDAELAAVFATASAAVRASAIASVPSALARVPDADATCRGGRRQPTTHRPAIPRAVVRAVAERDGGRCRYVCPETGRRCSETSNLHIHHVVPYAYGGEANVADLELRCAAHDAYQAVLDFGPEHMARAIARRRGRGRPAGAESDRL